LLHQCIVATSVASARTCVDRPLELAALLRSGRFAHGTLMDEIRWRLGPQAGAERMPLGTNISGEERDALLAYFAGMLQVTAAP